MIEKRREYRNPFFEFRDERIVLDSRICVAENCVKTVSTNKAIIKIPNMNNEIDQEIQDKITPKHIEKESKWLLNAENLFTTTLDDSDCISWTAYHSKVQKASVNPSSIIAMLLFIGKSRFPRNS